jgi:hypothetical protein
VNIQSECTADQSSLLVIHLLWCRHQTMLLPMAAFMEKEPAQKHARNMHRLKKYRKNLLFGVLVLVVLQRRFSASLLTFVQVVEEPDLHHQVWGVSSGRSNDGNTVVIEVKRPPLTYDGNSYANKTAFELLHDYNNCSALLPDGLACWYHCKTVQDNDTARKKWCEDVVCHPNTCRSFTCLLGNPPPLPTVAELHIYPPSDSSRRRPPGRRIPKIIHQTWSEPLTKERYPNWSQLQMSLRNQEGYDYRFYTDNEARELVKSHFPPEVVQAYDDLLPGAYKADLFRYCVLLIHGGVYADVDVLVVSKLDALITDDVGFVIPLDLQRFPPSDGALCLWNGFMAASPGHPYLAKAIENVVNAVRNRYNYVDFAHMVTCPFKARETEVTRVVSLLATGPCMLGLTVNQVLGRHEQTPLEMGEFQGNNQVPGTTLFLSVAQNEVRGQIPPQECEV